MTSRLRILRLQPFFSPALGGPAVQAQEVCRELARRGHAVSVVTSDLGAAPDEPRQAWHEQDGYRVWRAALRPRHRMPPFWLPPLGEALEEAAAAADLLCLNVAFTFWNVAGRRLARRLGIPYVYNAEGALCPRRLRIKGLRKALFLACYERAILRDAAGLQAATAVEAGDLARQGAPAGRIAVIPNGVALPEPPPPAAGTGLRQELGIPDDAVVVLFLGRLHAIKGLDLLLDAARPVLRQRQDLVVVVAGPEEGAGRKLRRRLQGEGLAGSFRWPGLLVGARKQAALAAADLFALPSYSEGLPNAALEAAAAGLPLWITDRCNLLEVVRYDAGTVDPPDPAALTTSLRRHLQDPAGRRRQGDNARRMVEELFSLPRVVDRLEEFYRGIVR